MYSGNFSRLTYVPPYNSNSNGPSESSPWEWLIVSIGLEKLTKYVPPFYFHIQ